MQGVLGIRILFVEDLAADAELAERELRRSEVVYESMRVDRKDEYLRALREYRPDVVVSDYSMPAFDGMSALRIAKELDPLLPFIILTGSMNEDTAVACMKAGASDYVIKEHMSRLAYAIREAIQRREMLVKAAEQEELLRQSEERYRSIFVNCNAVMFIIDPESGAVRDANEAAIEFYGWPRDQFIGKPVSEINILDAAAVRPLMQDALSRRRTRFQFRHRLASGKIVDVETYSGPIDIGGKTYLLSVIHDISERVAAEGERDALALKLAHYLSTSPTVTYSLKIRGESVLVEWMSENVAAMLGYSPAEALAPGWWRANVHRSDAGVSDGWMEELLQNDACGREYRFARKDGPYVWLRDEMRVTRGVDGSAEIVGTLTDITERKSAEEEIGLKGAALEAAENAVVITDSDGAIEWMNSAFEKLTGYGRTESIGKNLRDLQHAGERDRDAYQAPWNTVASGKAWRGEMVNRRKTGEPYSEETTITPVRGASGRIEHFIAVKSDVTERVLSKKRLEASLREKDVLLREIHHRVKNNMQVITSLLSLSLDGEETSPLRRTVDEITRRIDAMASIHELFYESEDNSRIDFSRYLRQLATSLVDGYGGAARPRLAYENDEVLLSVEKAIPAGLIASEFVSNALLYAFPEGGSPGSLKVALRSREEGILELEVRDDGVGLPEGFDPKNARSMGMRLVEILSDQLRGAVAYRVDGGTSAVLRFPLAEDR